jgi:hypothetical protein
MGWNNDHDNYLTLDQFLSETKLTDIELIEYSSSLRLSPMAKLDNGTFLMRAPSALTDWLFSTTSDNNDWHVNQPSTDVRNTYLKGLESALTVDQVKNHYWRDDFVEAIDIYAHIDTPTLARILLSGQDTDVHSLCIPDLGRLMDPRSLSRNIFLLFLEITNESDKLVTPTHLLDNRYNPNIYKNNIYPDPYCSLIYKSALKYSHEAAVRFMLEYISSSNAADNKRKPDEIDDIISNGRDGIIQIANEMLIKRISSILPCSKSRKMKSHKGRSTLSIFENSDQQIKELGGLLECASYADQWIPAFPSHQKIQISRDQVRFPKESVEQALLFKNDKGIVRDGLTWNLKRRQRAYYESCRNKLFAASTIDVYSEISDKHKKQVVKEYLELVIDKAMEKMQSDDVGLQLLSMVGGVKKETTTNEYKLYNFIKSLGSGACEASPEIFTGSRLPSEARSARKLKRMDKNES